eukprot:GILK01008493.1.p1 GENE.GILK01008493.1~~GILK01008493.1.p1  ORF type:complete len:429 (+),score=46.01 GILK01008493.1:118-1287(+)
MTPHAINAGIYAKFYYVSLNTAVVTTLFLSPGSDLFVATQENDVAYLFFYFFSIAIAAALYFTVGRNPGYVDLSQVQTALPRSRVESSDSETMELVGSLSADAPIIRAVSVVKHKKDFSSLSSPPLSLSSEPSSLQSVTSPRLSPTASAAASTIASRAVEREQLISDVSDSSDHSFDQLVQSSHPNMNEVRIAMDAPSTDSRVPSKYCRHCNIVQPIRAKHCRECEMCVHRFDHHCFWIGSCVGEGNHCHFWWFLLFQVIVMAWNVSTVFSSFQSTHDFGDWITTNWFRFLLFAKMLIFTLMTGGLWVYHTFLLCTNQTTWENIRHDTIYFLKEYPVGVYPFDQGVLRNIKQFCTPSRGRRLRQWELKPYDKDAPRPFNFCENEYWSCF